MINGVFCNINGFDINVLNISHIYIEHYIYSEYIGPPRFDGRPISTEILNSKRYILDCTYLHDGINSRDLSDNQIEEFRFVIDIKNSKIISKRYEKYIDAENAKNDFINEINSILKEYGHIILDDKIKKIII